jgi:hypothetical protein
MSTIYKFESIISEQSTIEFYKTNKEELSILSRQGLHSVLIKLDKNQLFDLIGFLLRIQSQIKNGENGAE